MSKELIGFSSVALNYLESITSAHRRGRLSLFLGAGISFPYGIPGWQELVLGLLLSEEDGNRFRKFYPHYRSALVSWLADNFDFSPTALARAVKKNPRQVFSGQMGFAKLIREKLYSTYDPKPPGRTLLEAIVDLVKESNTDSGIYRLVSFNFDDLLERRLKESGIRTTPVYRPGRHGANLPVLHPHGYLPQCGVVPRQTLVFTEDEYHTFSVEPFNWAATEIASILRNSVVLFLGLSMTDPNLRRLLDACRTQKELEHYVVRLDYSIDNIDIDEAVATVERRAEIEKERRGTELRKTPLDVERAIRRVLRQAREYDERLFADMGVGVIWMKQYTDMPLLIDRLRNKTIFRMRRDLRARCADVRIWRLYP